uniref:Acid phosphatase type 2 n=1 Tax=Dugesia japonica TaxID=6161 RepID=A0A6B9CMA8_DUGJA|nr:acid phosphatase type 2 [Dugesia japonica]
MLLLNFFFILLIEFYQSGSVKTVLKHTHIIYRHGDRAPIKLFPTDTNREDKWPNGMSILTNKGIIQQFNLGMWLRRRYNHFLGSHLNYSFIYVRSTDVDRTLMSAESNLAGMFYNVSDEIIKGFKLHPIPIHTESKTSDILLQGDVCPVYKQRLIEVSNKPYFKKKFEPYLNTIEILRKKTGSKLHSFMDVWTIFDPIFCEKSNNISVDDWVTDEIWKNITAINNIIWEAMNYGELPKIVAGFLLKTISENLKNFSETGETQNGFKMVIYSGHDTDIAPLNALFRIFNNLQPPYTACLLIELHYLPSEVEKWAVQVLYKNYTDSSGSTDIPAAIIPGCDQSLCPLNKFLQLTKNNILSQNEYNKICYSSNILFFVQVMFSIVATCLILFIVVMFSIRIFRKPVLHRYSKVESDQNIN